VTVTDPVAKSTLVMASAVSAVGPALITAPFAPVIATVVAAAGTSPIMDVRNRTLAPGRTSTVLRRRVTEP